MKLSIVSFFRVGIGLSLLGVMFYLVDFSAFIEAIVGVHPSALLIAFVLSLIGTVVIKVWIALRASTVAGLDLGFSELIKIHLITRFYTVVLPRGASALIRWDLYRSRGTWHGAAALFIFESVISLLTVFSVTAILVLMERERLAGVWWLFFFASAIGSILMLAAFLTFLSSRIRGLATSVAAVMGRWLTWKSVRDQMAKFNASVVAFQQLSRSDVWAIILASFVGYFFFILTSLVLAHGMGLDVGWVAIAWVRSMALLSSLVPVTVAGIGVREATNVGLLSFYGVSVADALAYSIALFAIQIVIAVLGGLLELRRLFQRSVRT